MKKTILFIIGILGLISITNAQKYKIEGNWLLNKVIIEDKIHEPSIIMDFNHSGIVYIEGREIASWRYKEAILSLESTIKKNYNGNFKLVETSTNEIVFENNTQSWHLSKYDLAKIKTQNIQSGFLGTWKLNDNNSNILKLLTFNSPDNFISIEKQDGYETRSKGRWVFDKSSNKLLMIGRIDAIRGKNKVLKLDNKEFILENHQATISAQRIVQNANRIKRLTFNQEMFIDENDNFIYDADEEKLPWKNSYQMMESLKNTDQLVYNYANLIENTKTFENKTLKSNVKTNQKTPMLNIDYIFNGYDRHNLPDNSELPDNQLNFRLDNKVYPLKDIYYRIAGQETITTKAGIFNCTILEAYSDMLEESYKLWLVNNKPGVYAKIIADKPGTFGHYHIYELIDLIKSK